MKKPKPIIPTWINEAVVNLKRWHPYLGRCYIALIPEDEQYNIEIEVTSGTIALTLPTGTNNLDCVRRYADVLEERMKRAYKELTVYQTRTEWEDAFMEMITQ